MLPPSRREEEKNITTNDITVQAALSLSGRFLKSPETG
jgi:hypothetical protein